MGAEWPLADWKAAAVALEATRPRKEAEAREREEAHYQMLDMISQGVDENIARLRVAVEFGINPHQVKISSRAPEVDVLIPKEMWDNLSPDGHSRIR